MVPVSRKPNRHMDFLKDYSFSSIEQGRISRLAISTRKVRISNGFISTVSRISRLGSDTVTCRARPVGSNSRKA